jgi:DNA polymerase-3 subunit delta'
VAVISAAHRLNPDAQNALLKTLEEPGPATCLVLCADETAPLLPTLLSRATRMRLAPLAIETLTGWLVHGGHADPAMARAAAIAAGGRPGLALTLAGRPEAMLTRAEL